LNVHLATCFRRRTRRVLVSLVVEPTVVSPHLSNPLNVVQHRAGVDELWKLVGRCLKTRGVIQSLLGRMDCLPDRATRGIVGRRWTHILCCFRGVRSPGARVSSGDPFEIVGWQWRTIRVSSDLFCCLS